MTKETVLQWVEIFLSRQRLVYEVINDLRPDLIAIAASSNKENRLKALEMSANYRDFSNVGTWTKHDEGTWEYFIHGLGCKLVNTNTKEPIEWDAPDLNTFHYDWFANWSRWQSQHNQPNSDITDELLTQTFSELVKDGALKEIITRSGIEYGLMQQT